MYKIDLDMVDTEYSKKMGNYPAGELTTENEPVNYYRKRQSSNKEKRSKARRTFSLKQKQLIALCFVVMLILFGTVALILIKHKPAIDFVKDLLLQLGIIRQI